RPPRGMWDTEMLRGRRGSSAARRSGQHLRCDVLLRHAHYACARAPRALLGAFLLGALTCAGLLRASLFRAGPLRTSPLRTSLLTRTRLLACACRLSGS